MEQRLLISSPHTDSSNFRKISRMPRKNFPSHKTSINKKIKKPALVVNEKLPLKPIEILPSLMYSENSSSSVDFFFVAMSW